MFEHVTRLAQPWHRRWAENDINYQVCVKSFLPQCAARGGSRWAGEVKNALNQCIIIIPANTSPPSPDITIFYHHLKLFGLRVWESKVAMCEFLQLSSWRRWLRSQLSVSITADTGTGDFMGAACYVVLVLELCKQLIGEVSQSRIRPLLFLVENAY